MATNQFRRKLSNVVSPIPIPMSPKNSYNNQIPMNNQRRQSNARVTSPGAIQITNQTEKMAQIGDIYSQTNGDFMVYEVEIVDEKLEQKYHIERAAEKGICVCKRYNFIVIVNFLLLSLMGVAIASTLILNNIKTNAALPLPYNSTCTVGTTDCDIAASLVCPAGRCVCDGNAKWNGTDCTCPNNQYFDGYSCVSSKNWTESCSSLQTCYSYLSCDATTSTCQCASTTYFSNNTCIPQKGYNTSCTSYLQCNNGLGLSCIGSVCSCSSTTFWNGTSCVKQLSNGASCTSSSQCSMSSGLYCTLSLCSCNATYFWSTTLAQCVQTFGYTEPCTATNMCQTQYNLFCQTTASDCNCPTTSVVGMCDCPNTRFWDGTTCSTRNTFGGSCVAAYACTANSNLQCSFGLCQCLTPFPTWNSVTSKCQ